MNNTGFPEGSGGGGGGDNDDNNNDDGDGAHSAGDQSRLLSIYANEIVSQTIIGNSDPKSSFKKPSKALVRRQQKHSNHHRHHHHHHHQQQQQQQQQKQQHSVYRSSMMLTEEKNDESRDYPRQIRRKGRHDAPVVKLSVDLINTYTNINEFLRTAVVFF
ncbi:hypothetical protein ACOME3_009362 [Neoechinorhynchus agilis]